MKNLKYTSLIFLSAAILCTPAFCAYLGFYGEETSVKPGDPFTIDLVAFFEEDDPEFWEEDPTVRVSLYDWVGSLAHLPSRYQFFPVNGIIRNGNSTI